MNVQVGAANTASLDFDQHIVVSHSWQRNGHDAIMLWLRVARTHGQLKLSGSHLDPQWVDTQTVRAGHPDS